MNIKINIFLDILILLFSSIGIVVSIGILFLIFHHRHQFSINTSTLLLCNTYLSIILSCLVLFEMYIHNLFSITHPNLSYNNWWCYIRAYLLHVGLCLVYHSYLLQSCFRFFRIVYYRNKKLHNNRFIFQLILIQWSLAFLLILPDLFVRNFQYSSQAYHCLILYQNFYGLLITTSIIFYIPMLIIASIYFYILYYIHQRQNSSLKRKRQRDIIVLHRIVILVGMLLILSLPAILLWAVYMITGYMYVFSYHLQWLTFAFSLSILSIVSIFLTPQLQELLFEPTRPIQVGYSRVSRSTQTYESNII